MGSEKEQDEGVQQAVFNLRGKEGQIDRPDGSCPEGMTRTTTRREPCVKSRMLIYLICLETAVALYFAAAAVRSYGQAVPPPPRQPSRSSPMMILCESSYVIPTLPIAMSRIISTNLTVKEGWASWYSTNSVKDDYRRMGEPLPKDGVFPMANGEPLDENSMTCALWITNEYGRPCLPDGRLVRIASATGCSVVVAWTDNGPGSAPRSEGVICDLTPAAMRALAGEDGIKAGRVEITLEGI